MLETHPIGFFAPTKARYLLLGSFPGKNTGDWFYGSKFNQFWPILRQVYNLPLVTKEQKIDLFTKLHLAISDVIYQAERKRNSNLDNNLINIIYNTEIVSNILETHSIEAIYFTSRFVEKIFLKHFPKTSAKLITLPSPSPRFAALRLQDKIKKYQELLPRQN